MKLQFIRQNQKVEIANVSPTRTLLELLRDDLGVTSCKEGCGEGDCGACSVVVASVQPSGELEYKTVNSCIGLASSIQGKALWTAQDIAHRPNTTNAQDLHPVQCAMVSNHASQCGFCTPGFVMSLFALYQNQVKAGDTISAADAQHALSGNLCRCTGYRAITQAAVSLQYDERFAVDEKTLMEQLRPLARDLSLLDFLKMRHAQPEAQLVAGTTDVGLWVTKHHQKFDAVHDVTAVSELKKVTNDANGQHIGAAVTLQHAFEAMQTQRLQLRDFAHRFAGLPVRNAGTLGGNVANGSPIGDSMPLLISLRATVTLARWDGKSIQTRDVPLETLYVGYRQKILLPDEVLTHIHIPAPSSQEFSRVYKVSKRFEDDISAVCLAINVELDEGVVRRVSIGAGGVAAVPAKAIQTEAFLLGKTWTQATIQQAKDCLQREFSPISDMRASSGYRQLLLGQLLQRFWLETQGHTMISLSDIAVIEEIV